MLASELITAVRSMTDEENTNDLSDDKILAALNRALQRLARLSVRHYPELLKRTYETTATTTITVPALSQAFSQLQVDVQWGGTFRPLTYTSTTNVVGLDRDDLSSSYPLYYTQQGNKLYLYPPSQSVSVKVRYELRPPKIVKEQGRITDYDSANGYVYVDSIGSALSTSVSNLSAFFNIIDASTGDVKATLQAASLTTASGRIAIKTTGLGRDMVYGYTVDTELPTTIAKDDYVCLASGSCIPLYFREYTDFLVQHATNDIKRTYNVLAETDIFALRDIEDDVKLMWSQRPYGARVKANNPAWTTRRFHR